MDALTGLLDGPRARGAFLVRSVFRPPWAFRVEDEAPLTVAAVVAGHAWVRYPDQEPVRLVAGDVALFRGPEPYTVSDEPGTDPQIIIGPGQRSSTPSGIDVSGQMRLGTRTWGNDPVGSTVLLTGIYQAVGAVPERLLRALPPLVVHADPGARASLVDLLHAEIGSDEPGQDAVLDRLLDLLLVSTLRSWFSLAETDAPRWYAAHAHPLVGDALRHLHQDPARRWTVASLAAEVGVSRSLLARHFSEQVGESPMSYLTSWRLTLAADLLCEPGATVATVAEQVGYSSPFALSTAFKRVRGLTPHDHRARVRARA